MTTQFTIMGVLKNLYPKYFETSLADLQKNINKKDVFNKINGSEEVLNILFEEKYVIWKLRDLCSRSRGTFLPIRKKYLMAEYD